MKYYKLLKDLPTFKAGDLFYINPDQGCLVQKDTLILAYAKRTLDKFPNILTDWFEEIEESENKRWRAKRGERYWVLDNYGIIFVSKEREDKVDNFRYSIGDYFKTEKEAEAYKEYLIARQVLLNDAEGGKWDEHGCNNWNAVYARNNWGALHFMCYMPGLIYFQDQETLEKSLKEHRDQWEIVRKYETETLNK